MVNPLLLKRPPSEPTRPLEEFIWEPFNRPEHAISLACDDADFNKQDSRLKVSNPKLAQNTDRSVIIKYSIHCPDSDDTLLIGSEVGGPQEKMSFFQIASGPILSIPIYLKTCFYGPCKFLLKKMTRTYPLGTSKS